MATDFIQPLDPSMGEAVAARTVFRESDHANWANVAERVALGNTSLIPHTSPEEQTEFARLIKKGAILMSGRHLQHGDADQASRPGEVFTNCSTAAFSFLKKYLLLNGSGVGRSYADALMIVDWQRQPEVIVTIGTVPEYSVRDLALHDGKYLLPGTEHPESRSGEFLTLEDAVSLYPECNIFHVPDTREGWAKAIELIEVAAYRGHSTEPLVIDFSAVRPAGTPIGGMQNRPSSGPLPLMRAIERINAIRDELPMARWRQTMLVDHYLAEVVLVGGARRSARIAVKPWTDPDILDFIHIKELGGLWTANNSVAVDQRFWKLVLDAFDRGIDAIMTDEQHRAWTIFNEVTHAQYTHNSGEPGFVNVDLLSQDDTGLEVYLDGRFVNSVRYELQSDTVAMGKHLISLVRDLNHKMIVNPCVTAETWVMTTDGPQQVRSLVSKPFTAIVNGVAHAATGFWKTGTKPVFQLVTDRGYSVRLTENHKVKVRRAGAFSWVEARDLRVGDQIVLNNHREITWEGPGNFHEGWLLGSMMGDGGFNPEASYNAYVRFWGDSQEFMGKIAAGFVRQLDGVPRSDFAGGKINALNNTTTLSTATLERLANKYLTADKMPRVELEATSAAFHAGFIRGFFDADGSVQGSLQKGVSVRLSQSDLTRLEVVQRMLARFGIASTIYQDRKLKGESLLPDGRGGMRLYPTKATHELVISRDNIPVFAERIGFYEPEKKAALSAISNSRKRMPYKDSFTARVEALVLDGVEDVFDCTVATVHEFDANGLAVHNCGEIPLLVTGGYCCLGSFSPYFCDSFAEVLEAARLTARALVRANTMDFLYSKEVARTNRIGLTMVGLHEWAWKVFGLSFRELLIEKLPQAQRFWRSVAKIREVVLADVDAYCDANGWTRPHTVFTMQPAGTIAKLFGLTEAAHLPALREYLRWVQFKNSDPLVDLYEARGYPTQRVIRKADGTVAYPGMSIVGFPTAPVICSLIPPDKLVTAAEATMEEQFKWLRLLEQYWLGTDGRGNQVSYTLKYDQATMNFEEYRYRMMANLPHVRCVSVMPTADWQKTRDLYGYTPEEPVTHDEYLLLRKFIERCETGEHVVEDVDMDLVACQNGACPL